MPNYIALAVVYTVLTTRDVYTVIVPRDIVFRRKTEKWTLDVINYALDHCVAKKLGSFGTVYIILFIVSYEVSVAIENKIAP